MISKPVYFARCFGCLETVEFPDRKTAHICPSCHNVVFYPEDISERETEETSGLFRSPKNFDGLDNWQRLEDEPCEACGIGRLYQCMEGTQKGLIQCANCGGTWEIPDEEEQ